MLIVFVCIIACTKVAKDINRTVAVEDNCLKVIVSIMFLFLFIKVFSGNEVGAPSAMPL